MNEEKSVVLEEQEEKARILRCAQNDKEPSPSPLPSLGESEKAPERKPRLSFVPNRHDRRKAAAIARKEARMEGKK